MDPLLNITPIHDMWFEGDEPCSYALQFVKEQTPEMCLAAVKKTGEVLRYVKEKTYEICLEAVKNNWHALRDVPKEFRTPELCMICIKQNGYAIQYMDEEKTLDMCLAAVQQNGNALKFSSFQTPEICLAAIQQKGKSLKYVYNQTPELCLAAITNDIFSLQYINDENITPELTKNIVTIMNNSVYKKHAVIHRKSNKPYYIYNITEPFLRKILQNKICTVSDIQFTKLINMYIYDNPRILYNTYETKISIDLNNMVDIWFITDILNKSGKVVELLQEYDYPFSKEQLVELRKYNINVPYIEKYGYSFE